MKSAAGAILLFAALAAPGCGQPASSETNPAPGRKPPKEGGEVRRFISPDEKEAFLAKKLPPQTVAASSRTGEAPIRFVRGNDEAGVTMYQDNGGSPELFYVEILGSGAIFFDADRDGDPDLYILNGKRLTGPPREPPSINHLYLNDGKGHFEDATAGSGLGESKFSMGVCGADYDNDGDIDLYVTNFDGPNNLFRNDGQGHFTDVAKEAGVAGRGATDSSCAFADVDGDGFVDLYVGYYLDHSMKNNKVCKEQKRDGTGVLRRYCNPKDYNPLSDMLFHNRGDGTFEDASETSGIAGVLGRTLGVDFADFDDDGDQDVFTACDRTANKYFENDGHGHFKNIAVENNTALSEEGKAQAGMGTVTGDYDNDGRIDLAVTYFEKEANGLYHNLGNSQFQDMAVPSGTARPSFLLMGWGTEFFDGDLDGNLDWVVADGHLLPNVAVFREPVAGYEQPNLFFLNRGDGTFENLEGAAGPGAEIEKVSRGIISCDIDGDGDLDLLFTNLHDVPDLLRNESPRNGNHWLMVRTIGRRSNRDGIGARITAHLPDRTLTREIHSGQTYLSQSDMRAHFGLGAASVVPLLEVRWPSGARSRLTDVAADQVLEITEPE